MKKVIRNAWGSMRLSRARHDPAVIDVEVWRRDNPSVVDSYLMRADELEALGSEEVRQWLRETEKPDAKK